MESIELLVFGLLLQPPQIQNCIDYSIRQATQTLVLEVFALGCHLIFPPPNHPHFGNMVMQLPALTSIIPTTASIVTQGTKIAASFPYSCPCTSLELLIQVEHPTKSISYIKNT